MSEYKVSPRRISTDEFHAYRKNWETVIADPSSAMLKTCFASDDARLSNYVFMEIDPVKELIGFPNTAQVQAMFVAAPLEDPQFFTIVLIPLDKDGFPTSSTYYLAGVASQPAHVGEAPSSPITLVPVPNPEAYPWIKAWNSFTPKTLTLDLFKSDQDVPAYRTLRAYTYTTDDFIDALRQPIPPENAALWLDFALHSEAKESGLADAADLTFAMTLCLNKMPVYDTPPSYSGEIDFTSAQHYFDLSKPCPPFCSVFIPDPLRT